MKAILFGLATGSAIQAWRNFPPDGLVTAKSAAVVALVAVLLAYALGRSRRGGSASATAVAVATASAESASTSAATVNVFNVQAGHGAAPANLSVPAAEQVLPWMSDEPRSLSSADLAAMDFGSILDEQHAQAVED